MASKKLKGIRLEKENLIIIFDDLKETNNITEYRLVWINRNNRSLLVIEEEIKLNEDNVLIIDVYNSIDEIDDNGYPTFDLGVQSKITNEVYKLNMNEEFDFIEAHKYINSIVDLKKGIYGFLYYSIKKEISLKLTKAPKEAIKKCKKKSYTINSEEDKRINIIENKKFNLIGVKSKNKELKFVFDEIENVNKTKIIKLLFKSRINKEEYTLNLNKKNIYDNKIIIDLSEFSSQYAKLKDRWDIFLECRDSKSICYGKVGLYDETFDTKLSSHFNYLDTDCKNVIVPYITSKKEVALLVDTYGKYTSEKFKNTSVITDINVKNNILMIKGILEFKENIDFKLENALLELRNKTKEELQYKEKLQHKLEIKSNYLDKNKATYVIKMDISKYSYEQFYWDFYLEPEVSGEKVKIRIRNPKYKVRYKINNKLIKFNFNLDDNYILYPYITANKCLSMAYRQKGKYETKLYKIKEKLAKNIYISLKPYFDKKEIWLIYEKYSERAQDNSFYFFKHCYENHPDKNIYYIITKDSKDYANIEKYKDKVIHFMSIKHLVYMCAAKLLVASESKGHSYAWRVQTGYIKEKLNEKKMVFLQHGVTALKRVDGVFKKTAASSVDLFVATSNYEKNIIQEYFGYKPEEIIVTGFTRWDVLKDKSKDINDKEIFFMPTWRNWLDEVPETEFEKSPYFINYMEILNSKELHEMLEKNNLIINYFVHPKFKYYIDKFSTNSKYIKIVQPGEVQVNELLMRASLLITDYSSVAWEMYYQNKPTIFYHFDINDYNRHQGSYLDMENELFGDRAMNARELISKIENYINTDFEHPSQFVEMRKKYFLNIDDKNCERTYKAICKKKNKLYRVLSKRQQILKDLRKNRVVKKIWNEFKQNNILADRVFELKEKIFKKFEIEYKKNKSNKKAA